MVSLACGRSPTAPSQTPDVLQLPPGIYRLELLGIPASEQNTTGCVPVFTESPGAVVSTTIELTRQGVEYVALSPETLRLTLRATDQRDQGRIGVIGEVSGSTRDLGYLFLPPRDIRISIAGSNGAASATVEGLRDSATPRLLGRISGSAVFSDSAGRTSPCQTIQWSMERE